MAVVNVALRILETLHTAFAMHAWYGRHRTLCMHTSHSDQLLLPCVKLLPSSRTSSGRMVCRSSIFIHELALRVQQVPECEYPIL